MVSPLTDRRSSAPAGLLAAPAEASPELLPVAVRRAVTEIAAAPGAWCPALSPDGSCVAYVTDRSGIPRLEVAGLDTGTPPVVLSGPTEEVVSAAWSPDGGWLAYLVSPGGSICAELHVVRPDGSDARIVAGHDPGPPSSPAAGRDRTTTPARSPRATVPTPTSSWSTPPPASTAPWPAAASSPSPPCRPTSGSSWPGAGPVPTAMSSSSTSPPGCSAG
ncbi:hypothetical protein [Blastococcus brunescens]|uniref:Dipeptidylpeptidase IV N-terminal domain-containing protein n=1 Tax=Blastococcus brunescens TaxID=1564165 RepID=A0ABZ1B2N7_9ACTN|nr:hypothetical protein [Blastococcus sp. BMG 8361]WRL64637.1 hypothetical protein U6N30_02245 [Blastococcus sp. BMG 8361]